MNEAMKEILNKKMVLRAGDIMELFQCPRSTAYEIIHRVKKVSDTLSMTGRVTTADFLKWYNKPLEDTTNGQYWTQQVVTNSYTGGQ